MGILGMFIGVPLFAVIYAAFRTWVNQKLDRKGLVTDTSFYMSGNSNPYFGNSDHSGASIRISRNKVEVTNDSETVSFKRKSDKPLEDFDDDDE